MEAAMMPQHLEALEKAQRIRLAIAALKRDVAAGRLTVAEALEDPRSRGRFPISDLLMAQPRWGRARARRALLEASCAGGALLLIPEAKRVDELTPGQRERIVAVLARYPRRR
jgi:hypothetical protein